MPARGIRSTLASRADKFANDYGAFVTSAMGLLGIGIATVFVGIRPVIAQSTADTVTVQWDKVLEPSRTEATLQVVITPVMARKSPAHDAIYGALERLNAKFVRVIPWLPYPELGVVELKTPTNSTTYWDFSHIDPYVEDYFATKPPRSTVMNFSTIPQWMFNTDKPVSYPADPNQITWQYEQGTKLRDPSMKELGAYFARVISWYTLGGFTDELGKWHESRHHYKFDYWEVLEEVDLEHKTTPEYYTAEYDAIVSAIRHVQPNVKYVGLALGAPGLAGMRGGTSGAEYFDYFVNPANHKPGIPLDMIAYHFYAIIPEGQPQTEWANTVFDQTNRFIKTVDWIEATRKRLSPKTGTLVDEVGTILPNDLSQSRPDYVFKPIPAMYWNLCAAQYAYLYGEVARLGIDAVNSSALVQPTDNFPSTTMLDWDTGKPNARYWGLKLIRENFGSGDKIVQSESPLTVYAEGFITRQGQRRILLVNMEDKVQRVSIAGVKDARVDYIDESTGSDPPSSMKLKDDVVPLNGLAVVVVTLND